MFLLARFSAVCASSLATSALCSECFCPTCTYGVAVGAKPVLYLFCCALYLFMYLFCLLAACVGFQALRCCARLWLSLCRVTSRFPFESRYDVHTYAACLKTRETRKPCKKHASRYANPGTQGMYIPTGKYLFVTLCIFVNSRF